MRARRVVSLEVSWGVGAENCFCSYYEYCNR